MRLYGRVVLSCYRLYTYYDKAGVKRDAGEDLPPQREDTPVTCAQQDWCS